MKYQYTLWLKGPDGKWLYEWANVFKSAEDAREYRKHLADGLRPGHQWVIVEKEVWDDPGSIKFVEKQVVKIHTGGKPQ